MPDRVGGKPLEAPSENQDCLPEPGSQPGTIHKDDHIWVITKPSGWLTHPDSTNTRPSVSEWCAEPVGIHQRLDIDTSGLLIVSRSKQGARQLQSDLESRRLKKNYIAALGDWNGPSQGAIKTPIQAIRANVLLQSFGF